MTEQPNSTPEDGAVELVATVTFRWTYTANPSDYGGKTDPEAMAAIDAENYCNDPLMYVEGEPAVTVEPTAKRRVDVVLVEVGPKKLNVIKEIRWSNPLLTLAAAAQLANSLPAVVREDIYAGDATAIVNAMRAEGATVELRPAAQSA
jgi:ribosomal protein L7/L12